jgi:prepilin signal peptidase PulO-like enzyme (type II secretory pathway)
MKQSLNPRFLVLLLFIGLAAALRIANTAEWSPVANFTPIGAMALFGGAYFTNRWKAFGLPLLTLWLSDLVINVVLYKGQFGIMYSGWYWIYGIFALIVWYGKVLLQKVSVKNVLMSALVASLSHWLLANLIVCDGPDLLSILQTVDFADWQQRLWQGVPYLRNFLVGTLAYGAVLFGGFEWLQTRYPKLTIA